MYFLKAALSGMKRRFVASLLTVFGGAALLTAATAITMWSYWLMGQNEHIRAVRSASVFIDSAQSSVVEEVLTKVMQMRGIESARIVTPEEFNSFLKDHFPDLHEALAGLGDEVVPRMLEVVFPSDLDVFTRKDVVSAISAVPNVARIDDGSTRLGKALTSMRWLSYGGLTLAIGLWVVLFIVCLGHYQNILYTDAQEIQLIRSFGATKISIILPWLVEAIAQSLLTGILCLIVLLAGRGYISELYNQFFGTIGYDAFQFDFAKFAMACLAIMGVAMVAHALACFTALLRGRIA